MKLFERTGGHWLFWTGAIYFVLGMTDVFVFRTPWGLWLQLVWLLMISLPFLYPPLGRWLNLDVNWDRKMNFLEWMGIKKVVDDLDPKNVVKLPVDYVKPAPEPKPKEHYRVGFDDKGMTTLTLMGENGYSMTLSMNRDACEQLIKMLRATYQKETD